MFLKYLLRMLPDCVETKLPKKINISAMRYVEACEWLWQAEESIAKPLLYRKSSSIADEFLPQSGASAASSASRQRMLIRLLEKRFVSYCRRIVSGLVWIATYPVLSFLWPQFARSSSAAFEECDFTLLPEVVIAFFGIEFVETSSRNK